MTRKAAPKDPKPIGRPTKLTAETQEAIIKAIKAGATHETAAMSAGISRTTFYDWKAKGEAGEEEFTDFSDALKIAEAQGTIKLLERIQIASEDPKLWPAAAWILERRYPEIYGKQRLELTGKNGGPIESTFRVVWMDEDDNSGHGE